MNVLFISPSYPMEMPDFTRGLAEVGAQVIGLGEVPAGQLPPELGKYLSGYVQVDRLGDTAAVVDRVRAELHGITIDRIECLWEPYVILAARLRQIFGIPGMTDDTVQGFRDKALMKDRLSSHGVRVPHYQQVHSAEVARAAAAEIGFPVVVKPIAGAGTAHTYGASSPRSLDSVLERIQAGRGSLDQLSVEEYVDGDELTYDAVAIAGEPVFESVAEYFPKPLEGRNEEWISPAQIVYRDPYQPELMPGIELGRAAMRALGMGTGFVHMEWFRKSDGEVVLGEIACRSAGAKLMDQINFANDFDVYREWARAVCWHHYDGDPKRRYHVAVVFKRALGQGRITRIDGLETLRAFCGPGLVLEHLLPLGHPRRNWKQTLLSDGYVLMRDPDLGRCREMMRLAITTLRLYAS